MSVPNDDDDIPVTFDQWADYSARLHKADPEAREKILVEHDLVAEWARCDRHYATMIANDLRAGRMDRAQAYAARFASEEAQ